MKKTPTKKEMIHALQVAEAQAWKEYTEFKTDYASIAPDGVQARRTKWVAIDTLLSEMNVPRFTPAQLEREGLMPYAKWTVASM